MEEYGSSFDNYIAAPNISGKKFKCFINQFNEEINIYSYLEIYEDIILKPVYK